MPYDPTTLPGSPTAVPTIGSMNFRGTYSVNTQYATNDVVAYSGYSFVALAPSIGSTPTVGNANWASLVDPAAPPFDVSAFHPGLPLASAKVLRVPLARAVSFAANFAASRFSASANAAALTVFDVQKNGVSVGSVSIASGTTTATFTTAGGVAQSFVSGNVLSIIAPATPDATLADASFCLVGAR